MPIFALGHKCSACLAPKRPATVNRDHLCGEPLVGGTAELQDPWNKIGGQSASSHRNLSCFCFLDGLRDFRRQAHHARESTALDGTGRDGVHPYTVTCKLDGPGSCQMLKRRLGGRIMRQAWRRILGDGRSDVNDSPLLSRKADWASFNRRDGATIFTAQISESVSAS